VRSIKAMVATALVVTALGTALPAGATGYDRSNPVSTGCSTKGLVDETRTAHTFGAWTIRIRRSTVCGTAWAIVTRTDGKKCAAKGVNCAKATITRIKADGTKVVTTVRQVAGTTSQNSRQLIGVAGARYTGTVSTAGGKKLGDSATLRYNADGSWTLA
jgi:Protein of unknown function (DUF2690)